MASKATWERAEWFRALGSCRCGKSAIGELMSDRNDVLARLCGRCADRELAAADRQRKTGEKANG